MLHPCGDYEWLIHNGRARRLDLFFEELEVVAPRGAVPDPAKMLPVCQKYHQELLGPPLGARSPIKAKP